MSRTVRIIYSEFLNPKGIPLIGGIESYIISLIHIFTENGFDVRIYQYAKRAFQQEFNGAVVIGYNDALTVRRILQKISDTEQPAYDQDLLIFATDFLIKKSRFKKTIAIQHGVAWDITDSNKVSSLVNISSIVKGAFRSVRKYMRFRHCQTIVAVDYNFLNWYRTQVKHIENKIIVIPNFSEIPDDNLVQKKLNESDNSNIVSIAFARRLVDYRGTRIFADAIFQIMQKYGDQVSVTIAGEGPDKKFLENELSSFKNVFFESFASDESMLFHSKFDVAVVPTIGSEGTSLSLLEAMSVGCAVVATNVGGMTNIILDNYNGRLINPNSDELVRALVELITDSKKRLRLGRRAFETTKTSFSFELWGRRWLDVIKSEYAE